MTKPIRSNILKVFGKDPESMDELAQCIIAVIENQFNGSSKSAKKYKVLGFAWDLRHSMCVSNTHSSPEGHPQNFRVDSNLPKGYPGWSGRVWIRYQDECKDWADSPFKETLTHTGTGGAGSYNGPWSTVSAARWQRFGLDRKFEKYYPYINCYSWDYRIYDLDWPAIEKWKEEMMFLGNLKGEPWEYTHKYNWTDPETLEADATFISGQINPEARFT